DKRSLLPGAKSEARCRHDTGLRRCSRVLRASRPPSVARPAAQRRRGEPTVFLGAFAGGIGAGVVGGGLRGIGLGAGGTVAGGFAALDFSGTPPVAGGVTRSGAPWAGGLPAGLPASPPGGAGARGAERVGGNST